MPEKHPNGVMETICPHCRVRYRITNDQLRTALGRVKCSQCQMVFNALQSLRNFDGELPPVTDLDIRAEPEPNLHEAMHGHKRNRPANFSPFIWFIAILLLLVLGIAQTIYYQRYQLINKPLYQQPVLTLCKLLPCDESQFSSIRQIKLLERNVFTHPVIADALMVTGSFVNQAPFTQKLPRLLISLFDINGGLIANRVFEPIEYLQGDKSKNTAESDKPVQFRLEIIDPGVDALTYEFDFY